MPNHDNTATILAAITTLAANFGRSLPDQLAQAWVSALSRFSGEQVAAACYQVMIERRTMPPLAVLIAAIPGYEPQARLQSTEQMTEDQAWAEWDAVVRAARAGSIKPRFSPVTEAALRCAGGWTALLMAPESQTEWTRRTFIEAFCRVARYGATTWEGGAAALMAAASSKAIPRDDNSPCPALPPRRSSENLQ